jgi:DNA-binding beta-propeller fold protein YncE
MRLLPVSVALGSLLLVTGNAARAALLDNTLWIGADPFNQSTGVLDTDRSGNVNLTIDPFANGGFANGIAVDLTGNALYFGDENLLQKANLTTHANIGSSITQTPSGSLPEDMTFDTNLNRIWRTDAFSQTVSRINPATNAVEFSFTVSSSLLNQPVGIAFDGTNLWVGGILNLRIEKFTTAGVDTGVGFTLGSNFVANGNLPSEAGGLAYDPTDNTLYIGNWNRVYHYSLTGTQLGFFNTPAFSGNRFVDGLEFEPASAIIPEPSSAVPAGISVLAGLGYAWRRRRACS